MARVSTVDAGAVTRKPSLLSDYVQLTKPKVQSLLLFTELGDEEQLRYARLHHGVIERFGRFPHRNAILGRQPRPDEIAAGEVVPW